MLDPAAEPELDTPAISRLVIRVKLIPQEPPQPLPRRRLSGRSLLLILGAGAVLLSWLGISTFFRADPTSPRAATERAPDAPLPAAVRTEASPVISNEPTTAANSAEAAARPVEPEVRQQPDVPPSSVNEAIPDVPQSALDTIRGTVRVSVRVIVDKRGAVVAAAADDRGPSRYFERLAIEASKNWTFTPANSEERRIMLVRFNFTRDGVTAQASPLQ